MSTEKLLSNHGQAAHLKTDTTDHSAMDDRFTQAGEAFAALCKTMARLRSPGGCDWDAAQTHQSLIPYLREEVAETIDAIMEGQPDDVCEELGDLLLQVVFHAEIAQANQHFNVAQVCHSIDAKLQRRHPHVFAHADAPSNRTEAQALWDSIKAQEKAEKAARLQTTINNSDIAESAVLQGVPKSLSALAGSVKLCQKAARVGFDWETAEQVLAKCQEETDELLQARSFEEQQEEFGDLLFAWCNWARKAGIDPELAMHQANQKFYKRFAVMEQLAAESPLKDESDLASYLRTFTLQQWESLWVQAKQKTEA